MVLHKKQKWKWKGFMQPHSIIIVHLGLLFSNPTFLNNNKDGSNCTFIITRRTLKLI